MCEINKISALLEALPPFPLPRALTIIPLVLGRGDGHLGHVTIPLESIPVPAVRIFDVGDAGAVAGDGLDLQQLETRVLGG